MTANLIWTDVRLFIYLTQLGCTFTHFTAEQVVWLWDSAPDAEYIDVPHVLSRNLNYEFWNASDLKILDKELRVCAQII